jgi:hypothetical protein
MDQREQLLNEKAVQLEETVKGAQLALVAAERSQQVWQKQVELYSVKGMSPVQLAFCNFLKAVKRLPSVRTSSPLRCFISYAWETDPAANKELQQRLQRLKDQLETAGMEVTLDIHNMKYDMQKFMVQNIKRAHKLILICTPRLRERATDPVANNLQLEINTALAQEKITPDFITPLLLSGDIQNAMPPQVQNLLAIHFTPQSDHYSSMASLAPMGLIPMLLGLERNKDYKRLSKRLLSDLAEYQPPI